MKIPLGRIRGALCLLVATAAAQAQSPESMPAPVAQATTEASAAFKRWDKNGDDALSAAEFGTGWREIQAANTLRALHDNFVAKDTDKSGSLEAAEYAKLDLIKQAAAAPSLATFDTDRNQSLDFKEYVGMIGTLLQPTP